MGKGTHPCFVLGCKNLGGDKDNPISMFRFPAVVRHKSEHTFQLTTRRRAAWIVAVNRQKAPTNHSRVCEDHFINKGPALLEMVDDPDWVPSLLLGNEDAGANAKEKTRKPLNRYSRTSLTRGYFKVPCLVY